MSLNTAVSDGNHFEVAHILEYLNQGVYSSSMHQNSSCLHVNVVEDSHSCKAPIALLVLAQPIPRLVNVRVIYKDIILCPLEDLHHICG